MVDAPKLPMIRIGSSTKPSSKPDKESTELKGQIGAELRREILAAFPDMKASEIVRHLVINELERRKNPTIHEDQPRPARRGGFDVETRFDRIAQSLRTESADLSLVASVSNDYNIDFKKFIHEGQNLTIISDQWLRLLSDYSMLMWLALKVYDKNEYTKIYFPALPDEDSKYKIDNLNQMALELLIKEIAKWFYAPPQLKNIPIEIHFYHSSLAIKGTLLATDEIIAVSSHWTGDDTLFYRLPKPLTPRSRIVEAIRNFPSFHALNLREAVSKYADEQEY